MILRVFSIGYIRGGRKKSELLCWNPKYTANIRLIKPYHIPNQWKFYEDSTELNKVEIVALVVKIFWFYLVHFFVQIYYKSNIQKKWTWWNWNISLTNTSHLKSDKFIKMLMKFLLIWYIVGFCTSNVGLFFWIWIRKYFQIEN